MKKLKTMKKSELIDYICRLERLNYKAALNEKGVFSISMGGTQVMSVPLEQRTNEWRTFTISCNVKLSPDEYLTIGNISIYDRDISSLRISETFPQYIKRLWKEGMKNARKKKNR